MRFRDLWLTLKRPQREAMALKAGTSYKYLQKLSGHFGVPSMELAARLKAQYPKLTFEGFLPSADTRATRSRRVVSATAKRKAKS